jgi:hypothetical protein
MILGCATMQAVTDTGLSQQRHTSVHVGLVMDKVTLDKFFSKFFGFPLSI